MKLNIAGGIKSIKTKCSEKAFHLNFNSFESIDYLTKLGKYDSLPFNYLIDDLEIKEGIKNRSLIPHNYKKKDARIVRLSGLDHALIIKSLRGVMVYYANWDGKKFEDEQKIEVDNAFKIAKVSLLLKNIVKKCKNFYRNLGVSESTRIFADSDFNDLEKILENSKKMDESSLKAINYIINLGEKGDLPFDYQEGDIILKNGIKNSFGFSTEENTSKEVIIKYIKNLKKAADKKNLSEISLDLFTWDNRISSSNFLGTVWIKNLSDRSKFSLLLKTILSKCNDVSRELNEQELDLGDTAVFDRFDNIFMRAVNYFIELGKKKNLPYDYTSEFEGLESGDINFGPEGIKDIFGLTPKPEIFKIISLRGLETASKLGLSVINYCYGEPSSNGFKDETFMYADNVDRKIGVYKLFKYLGGKVKEASGKITKEAGDKINTNPK